MPVPYANATVAKTMQWTDCRPWGMSHDWPGGAQHASHPPGWEPIHDLVTTIQVSGWICERVHWGEFERGPIHVILEYHNRLDTPESCYPDMDDVQTALRFKMLNSIWINDTELVDYARQHFEMPAYYSEIEQSSEDTPLGALRGMTWGLEGEGQTEVEILDYAHANYGSGTRFQERAFWFNDTGVSYMDRDFIINGPQAENVRYGRGVFAPPMLLAEWPAEHRFLDEWHGGGSAEIELGRFLDFFCLEPASD